MKKILHFAFLLSFLSSSYAQTKEEITSALNDLCLKTGYQGPYGFTVRTYPELSYLKRTFNLTNLKINDTLYIKRQNDYYYKRLFLYSKLMNEDAVVTEDCLSDDANDALNKGTKVLFYTLYPNSIKLPSDIIDQLEEYSTIDEFFGPYLMLYDIYFLKKYNYNNLSKTQKEKLAKLESEFSDRLFKKYVDNKKSWDFYRFMAVKVLKMNKNELVQNLDINDLVKYFNSNGALELGAEDIKNTSLLKSLGAKEMMQYEITAVMWIFLTELEKK